MTIVNILIVWFGAALCYWAGYCYGRRMNRLDVRVEKFHAHLWKSCFIELVDKLDQQGIKIKSERPRPNLKIVKGTGEDNGA
jgi:hypothetical protein